MTIFKQKCFDDLSKLADELNEKGISEEHFVETRALLIERQENSNKVTSLIEMSQKKFNKPFDL